MLLNQLQRKFSVLVMESPMLDQKSDRKNQYSIQVDRYTNVIVWSRKIMD